MGVLQNRSHFGVLRNFGSEGSISLADASSLDMEFEQRFPSRNENCRSLAAGAVKEAGQ